MTRQTALSSLASIAAMYALFVTVVMAGGAEPAALKRIVALGDSITDGHTYPMLIIQALREAGKPAPVIINAGAGGDTAEKMLNRLDDDVVHYNPDLVILNVGRNDAASVPPAVFRERVAKIIDRLRDAKIHVVMSTITPAAPKLAEIDTKRLVPLNDVLRKLAKERSLPIAKVNERLLEENDSNTLQEPDGIHLKFAGYRLFVRAMLDALGYPDVAVPQQLKITPLSGIINTWQFKQSPDPKPLSDQAAKRLAVDQSWKEYKLPETQPVEDWWPDSMRQWGVGMNMGKTISGSDKDAIYWGIATVRSDSDRRVWVNLGAMVRSVWLNGERLPVRPELPYHGWHPGRDRIKSMLRKGDNTIVIETGKSFFVSLTDDDRW